MKSSKLQRKKFIEKTLKLAGITDRRVLQAFRQVPREEFVPRDLRDQSYLDTALPISEGQTISQPSLVALMTQLLKLKGNEKVLEIGTGSGFQAAILSKIAMQVYSIERIASLANRAGKTLKKLKIDNVKIIVGDGTLGLPKFSPFNAIVVTAAAKKIPQALIYQLADNGRLVIPVNESLTGQKLKLITKHSGKFETKDIENVVFVPLIGKYS